MLLSKLFDNAAKSMNIDQFFSFKSKTILAAVAVLLVTKTWLNETTKQDYNKLKEGVWLEETINVLKQLNEFAYQNIINEMQNI